ncbi:MAG: uridine kinase [Acidobacteriota bacterium]|nr:uridine kinase [Acidobacteriota bacterium]
MKEPGSPLLIGIAGGTGTGKTTAARHLCVSHAARGVALLDEDSYYRDRSEISAEERESINYDEPSAIDHDLLFSHAAALLRGESICKPRYSFATHTRGEQFDVVGPAPLIILEGLFALWDPRLCSLMALHVYLDAGADIRLIRRVRRDLRERGRSIESIFAQYLKSVQPMHQKFIEPTRKNADLVLDSSFESWAELDGRVDGLLAADRNT